MHYQLVAPTQLLPYLSTRLALVAPELEYSLHTSANSAAQIVFQPSFFDHTPPQVEVFLLPSPLAATHGFMLGAAGSLSDLAANAAVLDALAPIPRGWLHLGEVGSASFIHQLWLILTAGNDELLPFWHNVKIPEHGFQLDQPQLVSELASFLAQQQLQIQSMSALAKTFLSQHPAQAFTPFHRQQSHLFGLFDSSSPAQQIAQLLMSFQKV